MCLQSARPEQLQVRCEVRSPGVVEEGQSAHSSRVTCVPLLLSSGGETLGSHSGRRVLSGGGALQAFRVTPTLTIWPGTFRDSYVPLIRDPCPTTMLPTTRQFLGRARSRRQLLHRQTR